MGVRRALLSVSDKTGLADFAKRLSEVGYELVASGGTKRHLEEVGLPVREVSEITGAPEILGGRVKTLHPAIHGGILARRDLPGDMETLEKMGWAPVDVVVCNLYPFEEKVKAGADYATLIENIDIGGVALLRAAAKNHAHVTVVTSPDDYAEVAAQMDSDGKVHEEIRAVLARKAFLHTSAYDTAITAGLSAAALTEAATAIAPAADDEKAPHWPAQHIQVGSLRQTLRYGENSHQRAAFYVTGQDPCSLASMKQLHGKELSYNNLLDIDGALGLVREFSEPACAIIKHSNPCGCAIGEDVVAAHEAARRCDPVSAFGGIIALNRTVTAPLAEAISPNFTEVVLAPDFDEAALAVLTKKKNIRLIEMGPILASPPQRTVRSVAGGLLVQDLDTGHAGRGEMRVVTKQTPSDEDWRGLEFAWRVVKWIKSNAIVYTSASATLGIGAGQMSRVDSAKIGATKAKEQGLDLAGSYLGSDAFFPFRDGVDAAAAAGCRAIIQPGGSVRDDEVIAAADELGLIMVFTGMRHFRH